ncbi:hypothetical protein PO124_22500 [Bacillus licheniformis]|nr:hypothetical protein [Bacillus licheniformis]
MRNKQKYLRFREQTGKVKRGQHRKETDPLWYQKDFRCILDRWTGASPNIPIPLNAGAVSDNVPTGQEAQSEKKLHGTSGHNPIGEQSTQQPVEGAGTNGFDTNQNSTIPEPTEGIPNTDNIPGLTPERNEQIPSMYGAPGTV